MKETAFSQLVKPQVGRIMRIRNAIIAISVVLTSGCATNLSVHNSAEEEVKGFPVRTAQVYLMSGEYTVNSKTGTPCIDTPFIKTLSLPTGDLYYVKPNPGPLADSEFSLSFTDEGGVKSLTINSEPAVKETIDSVAGFATDVIFPVLGVEGSEDVSNADGAVNISRSGTDKLVACDTGPVVNDDGVKPLIK